MNITCRPIINPPNNLPITEAYLSEQSIIKNQQKSPQSNQPTNQSINMTHQQPTTYSMAITQLPSTAVPSFIRSSIFATHNYSIAAQQLQQPTTKAAQQLQQPTTIAAQQLQKPINYSNH